LGSKRELILFIPEGKVEKTIDPEKKADETWGTKPRAKSGWRNVIVRPRKEGGPPKAVPLGEERKIKFGSRDSSITQKGGDQPRDGEHWGEPSTLWGICSSTVRSEVFSGEKTTGDLLNKQSMPFFIHQTVGGN